MLELETVPACDASPTRLATPVAIVSLAIRLGAVRLIDNIVLTPQGDGVDL